MADTDVDPTEPTEPETPDVPPATQAFAGVMDALVEAMRAGVRPDVLEAQRILLQRLAGQGDVFPSRIPLPRNITEVGGYLNLLERAGQDGMRTSAIASALGIAAPPAPVASGAVAIGIVSMANDRPAGPVQASIPPLVTVRADFHAPLAAALQVLHASGCQLPLRAPRAVLPATQPGATATSLDARAVLVALGRVLDAFPGTLLVDPAADALAIARPELPASDPVRLVARELDGGTLVAEASWVATRASTSAVSEDPPALRRYLDVLPAMQAAGWIHPEPFAPVVSLADRGTLATFVNLTGLVPGETTLGDELALLYTPAAIGQSALVPFLQWAWNGAAFAAPA